MNLLILGEGEAGSLLPRSDRRHEHLRKVLKKGPGDRVAAGLSVSEPFAPAPGHLGEALVRRLDEGGLVLDYEPFAGAPGDPPPLAPIRLILGFPRPIQAGRIFKDLASLGVAVIELSGTELGEKSYLESGFFKDEEWRRSLLEGAEQAANPRLPRVARHWSLVRCLSALGGTGGAVGGAGDAANDTSNRYNSLGAEPDWAAGAFIALHPAEGAPNLGALVRNLGGSGVGGSGGARGAASEAPRPVTLAIGSERGWTEKELDLLRGAGFAEAGLGSRILKTETATLAAVSIVLSAMGRM